MTEMMEEENALAKQVGGNHYASMKIQPVEFIAANNLGFLEGNIVKYVCRQTYRVDSRQCRAHRYDQSHLWQEKNSMRR